MNNQEFVPTAGKTENIERQECVKFVDAFKKHFSENFPFLKDEDRDAFVAKFDSLLEEEDFSISQVNIDNLIKRLRQIMVTLDNSHVGLVEKGLESFKLDKEIYHKAGTFWVDVDGDPLEVVSINDIPIRTLIEEKKKEIGGGTSEWKIYKATKELMTSYVESEVVIKVENGNGDIEEVYARFEKNKNKIFQTKEEDGGVIKHRKQDYIESKMLDEDIGYISINSWGGDINVNGKNIAELVEEELEKLKQSTSIIFDVRDNDGGSSRYARLVASHFIKERTKCCTFLVKKPEQKEMIKEDGHINPEGEFYDQKIVILTSPKCISATDMFLTFLKDTGRAVSIGQTTGGGSGNPQPFDLQMGNRKFELRVSCWRNYRNNGQEIENNGIEPDIYVEPTPTDVREHRDVELEKAVCYLNSGE